MVRIDAGTPLNITADGSNAGHRSGRHKLPTISLCNSGRTVEGC